MYVSCGLQVYFYCCTVLLCGIIIITIIIIIIIIIIKTEKIKEKSFESVFLSARSEQGNNVSSCQICTPFVAYLHSRMLCRII